MLTGVGRFHEMMYIIHLLLECDEFESLVHPKVDKVIELVFIIVILYMRLCAYAYVSIFTCLNYDDSTQL